jgi:hypothetical protein
MNWLSTLGLLVWRSWFVILGVVMATVAFMVTSLERILRQLLPAIFSILPDEYRRIIHLASGIPTLLPIVWSHFKPVRESCSHCPA